MGGRRAESDRHKWVTEVTVGLMGLTSRTTTCAKCGVETREWAFRREWGMAWDRGCEMVREMKKDGSWT